MGGYGSGQWRTGRQVVEHCLTITPSRTLPGSGGLHWKWGDKPSGYVHYATEDGAETYRTDPTTRRTKTIIERKAVVLTYTLTGDHPREVKERVHLTTTVLTSGGLRYWFTCPNLKCGRRVNKIYLPPGAEYFACRHCYNLTYRSCQEARKPEHDELWSTLAGRIGCTPRQAKRMITRRYPLYKG